MWAAAGGRARATACSTSPQPDRRRAPKRCASASPSTPRGKLTFVLAADGVLLGTHGYPTLDLTSPDAVMDAVGNTVADIANQLLARPRRRARRSRGG